MTASAAKRIERESYPTPEKGARVSYRCVAGYFYKATVLDVRPDGTIDVACDGTPPLKLTKRPWWNGNPADCPKRACTAKEMGENQR